MVCAKSSLYFIKYKLVFTVNGDLEEKTKNMKKKKKTDE